MFGLASLLNWGKKPSESVVDEEVTYPPIVMRLYKSDSLKEIPAVSGREFLFTHWRYNELNSMTAMVSKLLVNAAAYFGGGCVKMITLQLHDDYHVCAAQLKGPADVKPRGSVAMFLNVSSNDLDIRFGKDDSLYGAFTQDFMKILTHVAIRFNCVLSSVTSTKDGDIVAMYMPHDPHYDLETYFTDYYKSDTWMTPENGNGSIHHPDGPT